MRPFVLYILCTLNLEQFTRLNKTLHNLQIPPKNSPVWLNNDLYSPSDYPAFDYNVDIVHLINVCIITVAKEVMFSSVLVYSFVSRIM